ncbi:MAG: glycosyltransferase family 2 protein [Cyclobacteriaceae bacterium]
MKISICIPQYNRINYLLKSLKIIEKQTYPNIEISISDDCSTDETVEEISRLKTIYKYPIVFDKNPQNLGYDRNYRKCIEMACGDYALVIGNDDSIYGENSIQFLVDFLKSNNFPDVGFCNMVEDRTGGTFIKRALATKVLGHGSDIAIKNYSCFSFVGGLVYKREIFLQHNTAKYDGSIFSQMYLGVLLISKGATLFSIHEPIVLKDILIDGVFRKSYRDRIAKSWKDFRVVDGGIPSVINVLISALKDSDNLTQKRIVYIFKRIYTITYPHWILDYKENGALPEAIGLIIGINPLRNANFKLLKFYNRIIIFVLYLMSSIIGLLMPVWIFIKLKQSLYSFFKN